MSGLPPTASQPPQGPASQPQWAPPPKSPKGSISTKVWGVILLILGVVGFLMLAMSVASVTGGFTGTEFAVGLDEDAKRAMEDFQRRVVEASLQRWSFWSYITLELFVVVLSILAGIFLIVRPHPRGRKLAIARVLIVFVLLPITWIETSAQLDDTAAMQNQMMTLQLEQQVEVSFRQNPPQNEREAAERRASIMQTGESIGELTKLVYSITLVLSILMPLMFNAVLLTFMLLPGTKEYLESVAGQRDESIPGYDPSMGMIGAPTPPGENPRQT